MAALVGRRIQGRGGEKTLANGNCEEPGRQIGLLLADIVAKTNEVLLARQSQQKGEQGLVAAGEHIDGFISTLAASRVVHLQLTHDAAADQKRRTDLDKRLDAATE
ncbi:hypothetical protein FRB96_001069 [Tulasnella sp. 330]|nr:hypothetical protein FRB96_001069 [Tulasnella sp. 330]